jgi:hypothetical protein
MAIHHDSEGDMSATQDIKDVGQRLGVPFDLGLVSKAPGFEVPDIEGTVEGWRAWKIEKRLPLYGVDPKLRSVTEGLSHGYTWYPQQTAEAECHKADHVPAAKGCTCGFYSAKSLEHLMKLGYHRYGDYDEDRYVKVIGRVANWGQVTEGTKGWRSQYSYPVMLFVPYEAHKLVRPLMKAFGCKVRLLDFLKTPGTLDQVAVVQGEYRPVMDVQREQRKQAGRRCHHLTLPLHGHLGGEPYSQDGEMWVDVRWDVRPDDKVPMRLASLRLERVPQ